MITIAFRQTLSNPDAIADIAKAKQRVNARDGTAGSMCDGQQLRACDGLPNDEPAMILPLTAPDY